MAIDLLNSDHFAGGANLSNLESDPALALIKIMNDMIEHINTLDDTAGLGEFLEDAQAQFTDSEVLDEMVSLLAAGQGTVGLVAVHRVRCMITTNVADISAFTVASRDGLTLVEGDRVYLGGQTTGEQKGPYVVGEVDTGSAELTRCVDWATGAVIPTGSMVAVDAGTVNGNSLWMLTNTGDVTVGSVTPALLGVQLGAVGAKLPVGTDGAAADETDEATFYANDTGKARTISAIKYTGNAALTANDTHFGTLSVYRRAAGGGSQTLVAEITTETSGSGGTGNWTAFLPIDFGTLAVTALAAGEQLTFEITKDGDGVVVPAGVLEVSFV